MSHFVTKEVLRKTLAVRRKNQQKVFTTDEEIKTGRTVYFWGFKRTKKQVFS